VAVADLSTGSVRVLTDLNPEFHHLQLEPGKRIDVTNRYGDQFHGYVVLPPDHRLGQRYPLIITRYRSSDGFLRVA
jgi:dipeptidyl aminopeptidase/acylaminoacyl peptidase